MCGEQTSSLLWRVTIDGSPPRVRGTDAVAVDAGRLVGITPACAGNSQSITATLTSTGDHPRVCGEQASATTGKATMTGSPPRVRGTGSASRTG